MQIADGRSYLCCDLAIVEDLRSVSAEQQGSVLEVYFTERECQQSFRNTAVSESTDAVWLNLPSSGRMINFFELKEAESSVYRKQRPVIWCISRTSVNYWRVLIYVSVWSHLLCVAFLLIRKLVRSKRVAARLALCTRSHHWIIACVGEQCELLRYVIAHPTPVNAFQQEKNYYSDLAVEWLSIFNHALDAAVLANSVEFSLRNCA